MLTIQSFFLMFLAFYSEDNRHDNFGLGIPQMDSPLKLFFKETGDLGVTLHVSNTDTNTNSNDHTSMNQMMMRSWFLFLICNLTQKRKIYLIIWSCQVNSSKFSTTKLILFYKFKQILGEGVFFLVRDGVLIEVSRESV